MDPRIEHGQALRVTAVASKRSSNRPGTAIAGLISPAEIRGSLYDNDYTGSGLPFVSGRNRAAARLTM
jgi:hypothetical protein